MSEILLLLLDSQAGASYTGTAALQGVSRLVSGGKVGRAGSVTLQGTASLSVPSVVASVGHCTTQGVSTRTGHGSVASRSHSAFQGVSLLSCVPLSHNHVRLIKAVNGRLRFVLKHNGSLTSILKK